MVMFSRTAARVPVADSDANSTSDAVPSAGPDPISATASTAYYEPGKPGFGRLEIGLFAAGVATFAALYTTQPLLGVLAQYFDVPASHAAWSVSLATLLLGVGMLVAGPLSGRWARTRLMKWSMFATAALGVLCALAPNWPVLLLARAAQGLALAGTPAVALVYLREEVHPNVHPRVTGLYIGGTAIGGMTGRLVVGCVADVAGWRWGIGAEAILSGVCAAIATLALPPSRHAPRQSQGMDSGPDNIAAAASFAAAPARRRAPRAALRALGDRDLLCICMLAATMMGAFVALYNVLGLRLTTAPYHLSVFAASFVFCVYPIGTVSSTLAGRMAERHGRPVVVLGGCLISVAGVALTLATPLVLVIVGIGTVTFGFFVAHGVASGWAVDVGQRRGSASQASALYLLAYYIGSSVFGVLGTSLWTTGRWPDVAAMAAVLMLVGAAMAAMAARGIRQRADDTA
jgi:MFS transporter, YNFM family, putative membrane transport protein